MSTWKSDCIYTIKIIMACPCKFQVLFVGLGFACMVLLKYLEVNYIANEEEGHHSESFAHCQLTGIDEAWVLPVTLSCVDGDLRPVAA